MGRRGCPDLVSTKPRSSGALQQKQLWIKFQSMMKPKTLKHMTVSGQITYGKSTYLDMFMEATKTHRMCGIHISKRRAFHFKRKYVL